MKYLSDIFSFNDYGNLCYSVIISKEFLREKNPSKSFYFYRCPDSKYFYNSPDSKPDKAANIHSTPQLTQMK